jgi:predicted dehydrogenase
MSEPREPKALRGAPRAGRESAPLRVLVAGFGGLGAQDHQSDMYLPAFRDHPGFMVAAVCGDGPAEHVAAGLGVPWHASLAAALEASEAEVVSVCAPLERRAQTIVSALEAGRHVLADKPLAGTLADAEAIEAAARASGTVCLPAHHLRFGAAIRSARAAVAAGRVGLPWNVQADFLVAGGAPCPDGELLNFGLYPVDVVRALTGRPVRRVYARTGEYWEHAPGREDFALLLLDHDHGMTSTIAVGRTRESALHRYRISGSNGVMELDADKPAATVRTAVGARPAWIGPGSVARMLDELHAAITTGRPAEVGPADARDALRVVLAARESAASGVPVSLQPQDQEDPR